jgi:hypothetical protein
VPRLCLSDEQTASNASGLADCSRQNALALTDLANFWVVASLDRKRLGQAGLWKARNIPEAFSIRTRRKPLAFAADALRYGI